MQRRKAFSVTPVPSADTPEGYLYVVLRGEEFDAVDSALQDSHILRLSAYALLVSLAFGLLVGLLVFRMLTRRLRRLSESIEQFRDTGFTTVPPVQPLKSGNQLDEVDRLAATFDLMAERIVAQLAELRDKDRDRRDMVANISHDLRTPLASMNGYLETLLLKADTFGPGQRQEYLAIALRHGQRLAGLIDDLFELANLQAAQTRTHSEAVSIQDLVQDVTQKLGLRARDKGVALRADVAENVPLASADIGLIERVLDNLIANALDHSPRGGKVEIHVRGQGDKVVVAVTDEGDGIGLENLPHIFDRYYRGEARGSDHAGLGLAIARQILALHDAEIAVDSEPGRGATFTFALPAWRA
jgi:signal transduction histidine kinase